MFTTSTPVLELILRGTVTFLALIVALRVVGQRESGGLGLTDLLVVVLVADAASAGLRGGADSITDSFVLVATILFWSVALDALAYRWPRFARLAKARPKALIRDGELDHRVMRREFMTLEEVLSQLRLHGITDPAVVSRAYVEPNGMISVIRRDQAEPDTPVVPPTA
ncbi:DUF421 domain-containing protein [Georgenia subflava]|uniref:DUF421 domain-containing protein n=2 Tax=Georgenia subflava TaxID=1622177 RepID=A0A6N7EFJ0_9MICO|nr:DUF421 domain-containing protein [Georgenia subflava]